MRRNSKQGFVLSVLLHGTVAGTVVVLSLIKPPEQVREKTFELVFGVPNPEPGEEASTPSGPISVNLPAPLPTPRPQPPRRSQPQPTPRPPEPVRTPTPPPTPVPPPQRPAPTQATPAPPERISIDQFRQQHPQTTPPSTTRTTSPRPIRNVPRIDTNQSATLREAITNQGSLRGLTTAQENALGRYVSAITDLLHDAWDKPVGLAQSTEAIVEFDVSRDGRFLNIRITKSSGNAQFDQSVRDCFRNAGSPGAPPTGKTVNLRLKISMTDE